MLAFWLHLTSLSHTLTCLNGILSIKFHRHKIMNELFAVHVCVFITSQLTGSPVSLKALADGEGFVRFDFYNNCLHEVYNPTSFC